MGRMSQLTFSALRMLMLSSLTAAARPREVQRLKILHFARRRGVRGASVICAHDCLLCGCPPDKPPPPPDAEASAGTAVAVIGLGDGAATAWDVSGTAELPGAAAEPLFMSAAGATHSYAALLNTCRQTSAAVQTGLHAEPAGVLLSVHP